MKRRQDNGDGALAKMKRRQDNGDDVSARMKRRQDNGDEGLDEVAGFREYRTAKRRKGVTKQDPENSPSPSSCSDDSGANSSSSWDSWDSDNGSPTELPEGKPENSSVACATQEVLGKIRKEEAAVLGDLDHFWSTQVAAKARKELGKFKTPLGKNITSLETLNTRCGDVKKLMELPCVVSVGFSRYSKFSVFVTDRNKALELSEELVNPNIELVEARNSHLI